MATSCWFETGQGHQHLSSALFTAVQRFPIFGEDVCEARVTRLMEQATARCSKPPQGSAQFQSPAIDLVAGWLLESALLLDGERLPAASSPRSQTRRSSN
jgi:hypothetical protein